VQSRAKLGIGRELFVGLFEPGQGLLTLSWPLHAEYTIVPNPFGRRERTIQGEGYDGRSYEPLEDPDLFLSFVRLGSKGQPSETRILRWVEQHGLLTADLSEGVKQTPVSVDDFRKEVRCARELAALFMDIREKNAAAIYARYVGEGDYSEAQDHANPVDEYFATFQRDESFRRGLEPPDDPAHLQSGAAAFESLLAARLHDVSIRPLSDEFDVDEEGTLHLRVWTADEPYRPVLAWRCPDLRSALYLQFALMTTSTKPWRRCEHPDCRMPFIRTRKDRFHCSATCRSGARKYREESK
jgi:hypothetical protein